jgi:hypothetical protein
MQPGEIVTQSVELACRDCSFVVLVGRGARVPPCPCGTSNYEENPQNGSIRTSRRSRRKRRAAESGEHAA